jgi:hypothetical protein
MNIPNRNDSPELGSSEPIKLVYFNNISTRLPEDHLARYIVEVIDQLDVRVD